MVEIVSGDLIHNALEKEIQRRVDDRIEDEIKTLKEKIEKSLQEEMGAIVMSLFKMYKVEKNATELIIRVQNDRKGDKR